MEVKVKVCGVTRVEDALAACAAGADFVGFNFHPPSPRCIDLDRAREIGLAVAGRARLVGVFVNAARGFIVRALEHVRLDLLQFHGEEQASELTGWPVPTIRALRVRAGDVAPVQLSAADYILLDSYDPRLFGGTGHRLALDELRAFDLSRAFVAGGLGPETVAQVARLGPFAVDVASGVESAPGIKDPNLLRSFVTNAKSAR